jgi:hypothetical protein
MTYADKQLFLDGEYRDIRGAVWDWQSDRPSGGQVWASAYFKRIGQLTRTRAANNLLWFNSVMDDVGGSPALQVTDRGLTKTFNFYVVDCLWRGRGPAIVTDTQSNGIGTIFINTTLAQSGGVVVRGEAQTVLIWGSRLAESTSLGRPRDGLLLDSRIGATHATLELISGGSAVELAEKSDPHSRDPSQ